MFTPDDWFEFATVTEAKRWFGDYINDRAYQCNGYETDFPCGGSAEAVMDLYRARWDEEPMRRFVALELASGFRRATVNGDDVLTRGIEAAGISLDDVIGGFITAQLELQADIERPISAPDGGWRYHRLGERFAASDVDQAVKNRLTTLTREAIAAHPLAVRMWVAKHGAAVLGRQLYLSVEGGKFGFDAPDSELGAWLDHWLSREVMGAVFLVDNGTGKLVAA
ncbi:hypothetical protein ACIGO9_28605 [Nocardia asteroides]|uniref:hypothetical protein n=1 Tax=Nocardia asteroides TaxID=1824 RepID=UPI0037C5B57B